MKKFFLVTALIFSIQQSAFAYKIFYGRNVIISEPVYENIYVAGGIITINAPIYGDLVVAGGTIVINDSVMNDILLAGGDIDFNGFVKGDIRCAGGNLRIHKNVLGDVVITGGSIIIEKGVEIGELIASGGEVTVDGKILNNVKATTGKFLLTGEVMKDLDCRGGTISIDGIVNGGTILAANGKINILEKAQFKNGIRYWTRHKIDFRNSVVNGHAVYDASLKISYARWYYLGFNAFWGLLWYLGMVLLMILIIEYFFSNTMKKAGDSVFYSTWKSLLFGFLFCVIVPIAVVVSFISFIGLPIAIILLLSLVMIMLLATVITSIVVANWVNNLGNSKLSYWKICLSAMAIFILLKLLTFTPLFGWLIMVVLVLISFGSILLNIHVHWKRSSPAIALV